MIPLADNLDQTLQTISVVCGGLAIFFAIIAIVLACVNRD